ncbi:hypothetical protein pipiens_015707, partial [Culex pipiens pipiens]
MIYSYCDEHNSIVAVEVGDQDKTVLVSVYRPPDTLNATVDSFMELLDTFLTARSNHTTIVVGDFNLDLLTTTHAVKRYTNIVLSNGFFFCSNRPTRYETCLDHVLKNNSELLISVQQLQYNLFDHDAMFIEVDRPIELSPSTEAYYLKVDTCKFREFLLHNSTHTNELLAVEDNYNSLLSQLRSGLDAATSRVRVRNNKRSHSKPWFDLEMKQCIRTKNYWYAKHRQNVHNEVIRNTYTHWANRVTTLKRSKAKQHYGSSFARQQNNVTGTWDVIKDVLGKNKHTSQQRSPDSKRRYIGEANNDPVLHSSNGERSTVRALLEKLILEDDQFDVQEILPNTFADPASLALTSEFTCPVGQVVQEPNCVPCAIGTYFDTTSKTCVSCPKGSYQSEIGQLQCKSCPNIAGRSGVTSIIGARSAAECKERCPAGKFLDSETGLCQPCGYGFYQPNEGSFSCEICGLGQTTRITEATSKSECRDECKSGMQLGVAGNCEACPRGTYRTQGVQPACTSCPTGRTTLKVGASSIEECSLPVCLPGTYLNGTVN